VAVNFIRFTETVKVKSEKRVVSVTVRPQIADCTDTLWVGYICEIIWTMDGWFNEKQ